MNLRDAMIESFEVLVHCVCYDESIGESPFLTQGYEALFKHIPYFNQFIIDTTNPTTKPSIVSDDTELC